MCIRAAEWSAKGAGGTGLESADFGAGGAGGAGAGLAGAAGAAGSALLPPQLASQAVQPLLEQPQLEPPQP
jgi:hypothetical protein